MVNKLLTPEEEKVMFLLKEVWNQYLQLPVYHPWDQEEMMHVLHAAQTMVMSRPVMRQTIEAGEKGAK